MAFNFGGGGGGFSFSNSASAGLFGGASTAASFAANAGDTQQLDGGELLALGLEQMLDTDFVLTQTRLGEDAASGTSGATVQSLKATVASESRKEYLTAALTTDTSAEGQSKLERLSRELAALSTVGEAQYTDLADRRAVILRRLYAAYESEAQRLKMVKPAKRSTGAVSHPMSQFAILSGVHMMLALLETSGSVNPAMVRSVLGFVREQLVQFKAFVFANDSELPMSDVSAQALDAMRDFLFLTVNAKGVPEELRRDAIELLIGVAIARGTLSYFLGVAKYLLFPPSDLDCGELRVHRFIEKLNRVKSTIQLDPPSDALSISNWTITEMAGVTPHSMATDGAYVYVHCTQGLFKIGSGQRGTAPGIVYNRQEFRTEEQGSLAYCCGKLYYRSSKIKPAAFLVLSTEYLSEVGSIHLDGTGSIPTADNSALDLPHDGMYLFSGEEEEETADGGGDEAADDEEEDAISAQLRTLMATQGLTASQITTYLPQIVQMIGSDPSAMEEIINAPYMLYDFVEDMGGDMGFDLFDGGAPPPSGFGSGGAVAAGATAADDDDEDDSKKKYKRRTLLTTDGEFLYALQQVNVSKTSKAAEVVVHVFDPEDNFTCVQSTPLRLSLETDAQRVLQLGKGTNGKFGPGGEVDVPQGGRKKRSKKKAASNSPGQLGGGISFGNPDALNFAGDITVECWFKLSQADQARIRNYSNIYLLGHGANDSYFYVMFSSNYVYVGCGNNFGSVSCQYNASMLDFTEWTHLATTNSDRTWKIYINGMMVTQTQGSMSGICKCTGDWSLGYSSMSPTEKLSGAVADFRIWNVCRSDAQISDNMSTLLDGDEEGLVGYWPLDEGLSLTAVDRSPSKCNGTIDVGTWDGEVEQRPFAAPVGTSFVNEMAFFFEPEVFDHGVVYTNGEAIGFYHHAPVKQLYGAVVNRAKFRAFQLADGALVDEALVSQPSHMESQAHLVGCYNGRQVAVYVLGGTNTKVSSYKLIPPSRVLRRKVAGDDEFPTVSDLLEAYPLPEFDEEELAAAPSIETLQDGTTLNAATTVLRLLASVSKEVSRHQYAAVDTEAPSNLRKSHIVELVPVTFDLLYDLLESLSGVYFAPETEEIADRDVLLFSLVTCVRLLKSNIRHLVTWNVSASECGFAGTGETSLRRRFVVLLERLSKEMPTASRAVLIAPDVQSEVCDALTEGLKIFYMEPEERVRVLSGLIEEVLASGADTSPLRIQLLERYFSGQSAPSNVIALVPAITAGYMPAKKNDKKKDKKKDDGGEGTSADAATAEDDDGITIEEAAEEEPAQMSYADFMSKTKLLNNVLTLVIQDTESKLLSVATDEAATAAAPEGGKDGEGEGDGAEEEGGANNSSNNTKSSGDFDDDDEGSSSSLLRFLINVQTAIFAQMSLDEDPHTSPHFGFLLNYANHLSEACAELLEFTVEHVINKHADSEDVLIQRKARVSTILRSTVGSLLLPLFSALWGQDYTPKDAARLVPSVSRLMRVIDTLTAGMPDTVVAEETGRDAANASTVTMVNTKVTVSTDHPVRQGITEKVLTIPGVKEFKLTFDAQTFAQGTGQGMVITLYKKPNQQEAIETVTNYTSELTIKGDTVYVNYNSGYMNSPWGFSVTGEGVVEERRTAMPWLVDLEKSIGVMIGKCAARLVRGSEVSLVEANTAQWLSSDLFREGATLTPEEREAERAMLGWLPWEKLESNEAAAAALRKSYETSPATASLLEDLIAGGTGPAALVVERLRKIATIPKFPVPASVKDEVNATVLAVAAVLMHHNMFGETLAEFAEEVAADAGAGGDDDEVTAPEGLVKCFTHAHKLRRWFLDAFQKTRAAAKEDEEVSREVEYAKLSAQVRTVASFLITIVPATYNIRDAAPAVMARQTSIDDVEEISEEQLAARQTLMAWRSTTAGEVKFVTADEAKRFQMLWQMFLRFLSAEPDQEALLKALKERRLRACTRAVGLCTFSDVLSISKLASVRRELVGFVLPALAEKREEIYVGKNPTGMALLTGCGDALRSTVTVSLKTLYDLLVTQLEDPAEAGPDLIRATLHTFNLAFGDDQYPVALSAGIFPALKNLLSWVDEASDEAAALALAGASNETFHTSAWALLDALGTSIINSSTSLQPFINESDLEPLFEILRAELVGIKERLSVVAAVIDDSSAPAPGGSMEPLFGGADTTAGDAASLAGSALFPASTAGSRSNRGGNPNRRRNRRNRAAPRRSTRIHQDPFSTGGGFGTASSWSGGGFGAAPTTTASSASVISTTKSAMAPTSFGLDAAGNDDVFDDALNVKVLSLLFSLCHWGEARKRFNSAEIIEALFTIVRQGTARERMVTGRLLRLLFTSEHAPDLSVLDACVVSIDESLGTAGSDATAAASGAAVTTFLIEEIGMAVAASANVLINSETGTHTHLKDVPIPSLHSADGTLTWTELAMFVRHLVYSGGDSWASAVMEPLQAAINDLPAIVGVLPDHRNEDASVLDNIEDQALDEDLEARLWRSLGALAVCGGMFDVMRTGGRVLYVANGFEATVVSRTVGSADVSVLREEDGTVSTVPQSELSVVHETPFDPSAFSAIDISPIIETFFSDALKGLVNEHVADSDSDEEDKKDGGSDDGGDGDDDDDDTARTNASKGKGKASTGDGADSDDEGDEGEKAKKAAKKGKKKGKAGDGVSLISVSTLMKVEILARVSRVIYSYTLSPTFAADLLPSLHLDRLYALARGETELSRSGHDLTTMAAEDGIAFLYSELARRIRTDVTVRAVITDESLKISETFGSFEVHPTSELQYKRELAAKETLEAPLTYIRMDDACHAENCDGNIVVLDTYGPFQSRMEDAIAMGASAIVLVSSNPVKDGLIDEAMAEALALDDDVCPNASNAFHECTDACEELIAKRKAERKAKKGKKKGGRKGKGDDDGGAMAAAGVPGEAIEGMMATGGEPEMAMMMAAMSAAGGGGGGGGGGFTFGGAEPQALMSSAATGGSFGFGTAAAGGFGSGEPAAGSFGSGGGFGTAATGGFGTAAAGDDGAATGGFSFGGGDDGAAAGGFGFGGGDDGAAAGGFGFGGGAATAETGGFSFGAAKVEEMKDPENMTLKELRAFIEEAEEDGADESEIAELEMMYKLKAKSAKANGGEETKDDADAGGSSKAGGPGGKGVSFGAAVDFKGKGKGIAGAMDIGSDDEDDFSDDGSADGSKKKKQAAKKAAASRKGKAPASEVLVVFVMSSAGKSIRKYLNVPEEFGPDVLYLKQVTDDLVSMGYSEEHAVRALKKTDMDVAEAAKWLDENIDWLREQAEMLDEIKNDTTDIAEIKKKREEERLARAGKSGKSAAADDEEDGTSLRNLDKAWQQFTQSASSYFLTGGGAKTHNTNETVSTTMQLTLQSEGTRSALRMLMQFSAATVQHYAQRTLMNLFCNWPADQGMDGFGSQKEVDFVIQGALGMPDMFVAATEEMTLSQDVFKDRLVAKLGQEISTGSSFLSDVLHEACYAAIGAMSTEVEEADELAYESEHPYTQGTYHTETVRFPGATSLQITWDSRSQLVNGHYMYIYDSPSCNYCHVSFTDRNYYPVTIPGDQFYINFNAQSYYGNTSWGYRMIVNPIGLPEAEDKPKSKGTQSMLNALTLMTLLVKANAPIIAPKLLSELVTSLPGATSIKLAQRACHVASRLFHSWPDQFAVEGDGSAEHEDKLRDIVQELQDAYNTLRTRSLVRWEVVGVPLPHVQSLLELVLSARSTFPERPLGEGEEDPEKDIPEEVVQAYKVGRDGAKLVSLIDLGRKEWIEDSTEISTPANQSTISNYAADVCLRSGKWYWEFEMVAGTQFLGVGWVTREFQPTSSSSSGMNNSQNGSSWCAVGPSSVYWFSNRASEIVAPNQGRTSGPEASWTPGTVVGMYVDLDAKEMGMVVRAKDAKDEAGKDLGVIIRGFDAGEGLHPCISTYMGNNIKLNFGREPFQLTPPEGFLPIENLAINSASWLARYEHAANTCREIFERHPLDSPLTIMPELVSQALDTEMVPKPREIGFEYVETDGRPISAATGPDMVLEDDSTYYSTRTTKNVHLVFKIADLGSSSKKKKTTTTDDDDKKGKDKAGGEGSSSAAGAADGEADANGSESDDDKDEDAEVNDFVLLELSVKNPSNRQNANSGYNSYNSFSFGAKASSSQAAGTGAAAGLVFVTETQPDLEALKWCDDFTEDDFIRFMERKRRQGQSTSAAGALGAGNGPVWRPHEPVGYFEMSPGTDEVSIELDRPHRGQYVTVKILRGFTKHTLSVERLVFRCIHGSHPLSHLIEIGDWEEKAGEIREVLQAHSDFTGWTLKMDESVVALAQTFASKTGVAKALDVDAVMLRPTADDLIVFKQLAHVHPDEVRARFALLKYLNKVVTPLLQYVDVSMYAADLSRGASSSIVGTSDSSGPSGAVRRARKKDLDAPFLSHIIYQLKGLFFIDTKKSVLDAMLGLGAAPTNNNNNYGGFGSNSSNNIRITINRIQASKINEKEELDEADNLQTIFGQLFSQLRGVDYQKSFRGKKGQNLFYVDFAGEGSIDVGGPYREAITYACQDLMSDRTPLFIPSANQANSVGLNREKRILNPAAKSGTELSMFEFVGAMFGMALRTKVAMPVDLPSLVWKGLLGEEADLSDFEAVDKLCVQALDQMVDLPESQFATVVGEHFTTRLSDGSVVELKKGGSRIPVTYETRAEFRDLVIRARIHEADEQIEAMRKGLNAVVPMSMLTLFSPMDLELLVCGKSEIDVEALKSHTTYNGYTVSDAVVKMFWKCLRSFTNEEKQLFLRFVWGRNRLPLGESDWTQNFTINRMASKTKEADAMPLPVAHTCFFALDLPDYPTFDVMRSKLLYSIVNCQAIDTDYNQSSSLNTWL